MGTKTISIMDDVYKLLIQHKHEEESFSQEIRRILIAKKSRPLSDFFGIISEEEGDYMLKSIEEIRAKKLELKKRRYLP